MTLPLALEPLARAILPENAMLQLSVPTRNNATPDSMALVSALSLEPILQALAWLYIDELDRAHDICQSIEGSTGAALHAIVHRREGDYWNALYWWERAGGHPALANLDPIELTKAIQGGDLSKRSIDRQRAEWEALAHWCAA